jgi:RNA polymerase sigma factor (sigma-70 family)
MNVHVSYKASKTPQVEREFQHQLQKLQRRLQVFKPDLVHFHAVVEQENSRSASTTLKLRLPSGQMAAQKSGVNSLAAVKSAFADLLSQVTKHKELLRGHWTGKPERAGDRSRTSDAGLQLPPMVASANRTERMLRHDAAVHDVAAAKLETWLSANLPRLEEFVDRELRFQVEAEQIRDGQITREEVIDEVIVSALSQEDGKAQLLSLESWFHRLALQAIRRLITANADTASISLDEPAGTQNVTGSDENVLQYHQPDDSLPEESVIRDMSVRTPEEIMAGDEMLAQLEAVLRGVGTQEREAFVLFTLEGFTVEEIARLTGRSADQVRQSVHQARTHIQQKLPPQSQIRRSLLGRSRVA